MSKYIISTGRLGLRRWIETDTQPFIEMNSDPHVMKYFPKLLTEEETLLMIQRIHNGFEKNGFGLFVVENKQTQEFLGFTGFSVPVFESFFTPCIEIGWRYKKQAWGQGFATEAANACLQYGFSQLGFDKIVSFTAAINIKSEKLMQRIGMNKINEFEHPNIEKTHPVCRHVLYEIASGN
jgi:RimJ/RimL family protein N-acetyltransferase